MNNQDDQYPDDPAPRWWRIVVLVAMAGTVLVFSGCADPLRPPPPEAQTTAQVCVTGCRDVHVQIAMAPRDSYKCKTELCAVMSLEKKADIAAAGVDAMASCVGRCNAPAVEFESSQQQHDKSATRVVEVVAGALETPLTLASGFLTAAQFAKEIGKSAGQSATTITGDNNAAHDSDTTQPVDINANEIGGGGSGDSSDGDVVLPK